MEESGPVVMENKSESLQKSQPCEEKQQKGQDCSEVEFRHPLPIRPKGEVAEKERELVTSSKVTSQSERKRHSEPLPQRVDSNLEGRKCFERRRLWTSSKQESFDLPEEFKCPTEDNVFSDLERSRKDQIGRPWHQRSLSVPAGAKLPDVVPEPKASSENSSPDVVSNPIDNLEQMVPVKSILSRQSSASVECMLEEKEKKQNFEGTVCYEPVSFPQEIRRKKSVTFETAVQLVRIMSPRGVQARSHFRSSGYGSQSDNSQVSQGSNMSSEPGSIFSDDDKRSFEDEDPSQFSHSSFSSTNIDGSIEDRENKGDRSQMETVPLKDENNSENSQPASLLGNSSPQTSTPQTPEELDEIEIWRRQMSPKFHYNAADDEVPNLSIFETMKEAEDNRSIYCPDIRTGQSSDPPQQGAGKTSDAHEDEVQPYDVLLPSQSLSKALAGKDIKTLDGESSGNKTSPTTKEEIQRELYKRLFEERMLKFDPNNETISDLFEWVKKNIGEALTPSPRSPFFPADGSTQSENFKIPPGLVAVTNALQSMGMTATKDNLLAQFTGITENRPPPSNAGGTTAPFHPTTKNRLTPLSTVLRGNASKLVPASTHGSQAVALSQRPAQGVEHTAGSQLNIIHRHQLAHPHAASRDQVDSRAGVKMWDVNQAIGNPPARYQQDLPATLDDVMSSIFASSNDMSCSVGFSHVEQLINNSQCSYTRCTDNSCVQGKKNLQKLQEALKRGPSDLDAEDLHMLKVLHEHYGNCDFPNCPVPWCRFITHRGQQSKSSQELMKLFSSPLLTLLPSHCNFDVFLKLDHSLPAEKMLHEWEDWLMLYPLSYSFTVARVTPLISLWPHKHWVVKMTRLHEEGNQLEVYKKLRNLQHAHIINHIWLAASYHSELLVVCTDFSSGISLRDMLDQQGCFGGALTRHYLTQILLAAQHLHHLDIVFLNWTCCNLLVDESLRTVKLTNFATSVELSSGSAEHGDIKLTLPADIVPAELLVQGGELTHNSDSWGLGCVLHEMLIGTRPWYHLRHCCREDTCIQILKQVPPALTSSLPPCARLMIHHCLQRSPDDRLSVKDVMGRLYSQWS